MNTTRWQQVLSWPLDNPKDVKPFSARLLEANEWDEAFTKEAIEEYRKFMYLKTVTRKPLTPSVVVDSVWHMHILYMRNYEAFCEKVIGRMVYHDPGGGSEEESERFKEQYFDTLLTYLDNFGEPPIHIWGHRSCRLDTGSAG